MEQRELVLRTAPRVARAYRDLKGSEIRLLKVKSAPWEEHVSCTLYHVPLDERPQYVALSYTWGNPKDAVDILLNGKRHSVTRNLFTALRRFRQLCSQRRSRDGFTFCKRLYLWADALCIDQANQTEKEREIQRMRDIYTLSTRVCAWLGENTETGGDWTRRQLEKMLKTDWFRDRAEYVQLGKWEVECLKEICQEIEERLDADFENVLDVLYDLGKRDWFHRVWVIQEAALPKAEPILIAGRFLFRFDCFTALCEIVAVDWRQENRDVHHLFHHIPLLRGRVELHREPVQIRGDLDARRKQFGRAFGAAVVRWGGGFFQATKQHDYIYGMIGLCGDKETIPPALSPNYERPFLQVCEDYARWIIKSTGSAAILARDDSKTFDDLDGFDEFYEFDEFWEEDRPSWVPDFSEFQPPDARIRHSDPSAVSFLGPEERLLKIRGFNIGKVTAVYLPLGWTEEDTFTEEEDHDEDCSDDEYDYSNDEYDYSDDEYDFSDHLRHYHEFLRKVAQERCKPSKYVVANWLDHNIKSCSAWLTQPTTQELLKMYWHYYHLHQDGSTTMPSHSEDDRDVYKTFVHLTRKELTGRNKFLCQGGAYAETRRRGCPPVQRGDCLVTLTGSNMLFLLRPVPTTEGPGYILLSYCDACDDMANAFQDMNPEWDADERFEDFIIA